MDQKIDISVVLAITNEAIYLREALASILAQSGPRVEVIVVDDASDDDSFAIVSQLEHPSVRLFRSPGAGKVAAFNFGVSRAVGEFVCLFGGDDIMPADSLAARWQSVRGRGGPTVGLCKIETLCADKRHDGLIVPRRSGRGSLSGASPLMNRSAVARLFPVPEHLPNEDTWLELAIRYLPGLDVVHGDIIGCRWRIHERNSMNLRFDFATFNTRYTQRMRALSLFRQHHAGLSPSIKRELDGLIECEFARANGKAIGVLMSRTSWLPKLRALAYTNAVMYGVRSRFYSFLLGW
jgi:glycosyltransferase involved in cell wall biosynthesis